MTKVYVLQQHCEDYYCGCGGGHILGIFDDKEGAELMVSGYKSGNRYAPDVSITAVPLNLWRFVKHAWLENPNAKEAWT